MCMNLPWLSYRSGSFNSLDFSSFMFASFHVSEVEPKKRQRNGLIQSHPNNFSTPSSALMSTLLPTTTLSYPIISNSIHPPYTTYCPQTFPIYS